MTDTLAAAIGGLTGGAIGVGLGLLLLKIRGKI